MRADPEKGKVPVGMYVDAAFFRVCGAKRINSTAVVLGVYSLRRKACAGDDDGVEEGKHGKKWKCKELGE